jgi:uncharacterized DUF497 family protein
MALTFEWDSRKASANLAKHGVSFSEALTVFSDPAARIIVDHRHSRDELRMIVLGKSIAARYLAVMFTHRQTERIRLISARNASRRERRQYEERKQET